MQGFFSEKLLLFSEKCYKIQEMHTFSLHTEGIQNCSKPMYGLSILVESIPLKERNLLSVNCCKVIQ